MMTLAARISNGNAGDWPSQVREHMNAYRAEAPKYLEDETDTAVFWALDSAAKKITGS